MRFYLAWARLNQSQAKRPRPVDLAQMIPEEPRRGHSRGWDRNTKKVLKSLLKRRKKKGYKVGRHKPALQAAGLI